MISTVAFTSGLATLLTVMVAFPAAFAVTTPASLTSATALSLDSYFRSLLSVVSSGVITAVSFAVSPTFSSLLSAFTETPVIGFSTTGSPFTFTEISAYTSLSFTETLILVSPALTAVTLPFSSTVATVSSSDVNTISPFA